VIEADPTGARAGTTLRTMVSTGSPMAPYADQDVSTDDWPAQFADSIENVVGQVRDKTTGPLLTIARGLVYGTFAGVLGLTALIVGVIALIRFVDAYLPDSVFGEKHTWATYLILGVIFTAVGAVLWTRRRPREHSLPVER
jgi:hypothetical protein